MTKLVLGVNRSAVCGFGERLRCLRLGPRASNSQPTLRVQIFSGHYNTAVRVPLPLQLRESETFDLGSVSYKDSDELCVTCGLFAQAFSVQKGSLRYPALFNFAAVLHNEMDVIAASDNHENGPQTGVSLTDGGLSGPYKRGLHERINLPVPIFHRPTR